MNTYDVIARSYNHPSRMSHPVRQAVYREWFGACGEIAGKRTLDLGCGTGVSSRMLREGGARSVVGIDNSSAMLEIARSAEALEKSPIAYHEGDIFKCIKHISLRPVELVTAVLAVHYACTPQELEMFFTNVSNSLIPDGQFVAVLLDPIQTMPFGKTGSTHQARCVEERADGRVIEITLLGMSGEPLCSFVNYQWRKVTYESLLTQSAFTEIRWAKHGLEQTALVLLTAKRRK